MPPAVLDRAFIQDLFRQIEWRGQIDQHLIVHPKTSLLMVLVPAGKILSTTGGEKSLEIGLPSFYIALRPVTNEQYDRFVAETGYQNPEKANWDRLMWQRGPKGANDPMLCANERDVMAYCRWAELRLPTELEWQKAIRSQDGSPFGVMSPSSNAWEWCAGSNSSFVACRGESCFNVRMSNGGGFRCVRDVGASP